MNKYDHNKLNYYFNLYGPQKPLTASVAIALDEYERLMKSQKELNALMQKYKDLQQEYEYLKKENQELERLLDG